MKINMKKSEYTLITAKEHPERFVMPIFDGQNLWPPFIRGLKKSADDTSLEKHLQYYLPELLKQDEESQQLIELLLSFESWERLRELQGMSKKKAIEIIRFQVEKLLDLKTP